MLYLVPIVLLRSDSRQRGASFAPITPDMQLAIERRPGHAGAMAKKRKRRHRIDTLIDAQAWLRRQSF